MDAKPHERIEQVTFNRTIVELKHLSVSSLCFATKGF